MDTVRSGMQPHITYLRQHGKAALDDVFHGETYWTDAQLQKIADLHSEMTTVRLQIATPDRLTYRLEKPKHYWYDPATIKVYDRLGDELTTGFDYDEQYGEFVFEDALELTVKYYAVGRLVNMYEALADLWFQKAGQREDYINIKGGANKLDSEAEYKHCVEMGKLYRSRTVKAWRRGR